MFDKSYFETLQDYLASGCTMELTDEELDYYNVLYALVGINRKYGKDNAVAFLMHEPFNVERMRARQMYSEAHRNMMYDNLMKAAQVVLQNATSAKDMEVYGNLTVQAARIKQLDKPDPIKPKEMDEKPIKVYDLDPNAVGLPSANRNLLAAQIDGMQDISAREKTRLKRDANIIDVDIEEMLDDQEEKTKDIG